MSAPSSPQATTTPAPGTSYPYLLHRAYLCGHPDEFIEVDRCPPTQRNQPPFIQHTLIPPPKPSLQGNPYLQSLERCTLCAREHQAHKQQQHPNHPISKLAAHQGQVQGNEGYIKDGFLQVLARYRFQGGSRAPFAWKDEGAESGVYNFLKDVHVQAETVRASKPHAIVPYRARRDKHVIGPQAIKKQPNSTYVIMVNVHEDLIPPRSPTPPPEPTRHSDSALLDDNHHSHPNPHILKRDSGGTSLSFGDQPRNTALLPARAETIRGRGGHPLPVLRNRRDMLKEKVSASPGSGNPRSPMAPRHSDGPQLSDSSGRTEPTGDSKRRSQEGVHRRSGGHGGSSSVARRGSQASSHRGPFQDTHRSPREFTVRNPYEYSPQGMTDANNSNVAENSLRRSNTAHSHQKAYAMPNRRESESSHRGHHGSSRRRVSEGASHGSYGDFDHRDLSMHGSPVGYSHFDGVDIVCENISGARQGDGRRRTRTRATTDQFLQPGLQGQDSDSDASSVGRW